MDAGRSSRLHDYNRPSHFRVNRAIVGVRAGGARRDCELLVGVECGRFLKLLFDADDCVWLIVAINPGDLLTRLHG